MLVATCNVNGIRAAVRKGMRRWLDGSAPDVLLLQEVRAPEELVPDLIGAEYKTVVCESVLKGRAGVAAAVRRDLEIDDVRYALAPDSDAGEPDVDTGRWIEIDVPEYRTTFVSAYLHSGVADRPEKMAAKYAHLERVSKRLAELCDSRPLPHLLVCGDFNIVHTEQDIKNWKSNHNRTAGVLDSEIAYLDRWISDFGYADVQRILAPDSPGPYTWWSNRGQAFDRDTGWRIDYHLADMQLALRAADFRIDRAQSYGQRWSDHAPLLVTYREE